MKKYLLILFSFFLFTSQIFAGKIFVDFKSYYDENPDGIIQIKVDGAPNQFPSDEKTEISFNNKVYFYENKGNQAAIMTADGFKISLVKENGKWVFQVDYVGNKKH